MNQHLLSFLINKFSLCKNNKLRFCPLEWVVTIFPSNLARDWIFFPKCQNIPLRIKQSSPCGSESKPKPFWDEVVENTQTRFKYISSCTNILRGWQLLLQVPRVEEWENTVSVKVRHVGEATTFLLVYVDNQERQVLYYNYNYF